MASIDDYEKKLNEFSQKVWEAEQKTPGAVNATLDSLADWIPSFILDPMRDKANDALSKLPAEATKVQNFCDDECGKIVDVRSMTGAANAYSNLHMGAIVTKANELVEKKPDWQSDAETMYSARRTVVQSKVTTFDQTVKDMVTTFNNLDAATDSYFLGATLLVAGVIVGVIGLLMSIPSGGWSLLVAIVGLVITLIGWFTLPDIDQTLADAQAKFTELATTISKVSWGEPTADSDWKW